MAKDKKPAFEGSMFLQPPREGLSAVTWYVKGATNDASDGDEHRWVNGELRVTDGSNVVVLCEDLDVAERALLALSQYIRALRKANDWANA